MLLRNMASKVVYGYEIKSNEQYHFKKLKFKANLYFTKQLKVMVAKDLSPGRKLRKGFQNKFYKNDVI